MGLAPYRLGLTATPKRSDGRELDLDTLIGPVVYHKQPGDLKGLALSDYREVQILVRLSPGEQTHYDELIAVRNAFLSRMNIQLGSLDGWKTFVMQSGTLEGRRAMLAYRGPARWPTAPRASCGYSKRFWATTRTSAA